MNIVFSAGMTDMKRKDFAQEKGNIIMMCKQREDFEGPREQDVRRNAFNVGEDEDEDRILRERRNETIKEYQGKEKYPENHQTFSVAEGNCRKAEKRDEVQKWRRNKTFILRKMSWMINRRG